jgi:hypothetical protein
MNMPSEISYSRTIKLSKDYNSEAISITCKLEFLGNDKEKAYQEARQFVEQKMAEAQGQKGGQAQATPIQQKVVSTQAPVAHNPQSNDNGSDRKWGVISEKQIKFLSFQAQKNGVDKRVLWDKIRDLGAFASFKDGKNNLTRPEFDELLRLAGHVDEKKAAGAAYNKPYQAPAYNPANQPPPTDERDLPF